MGNRWRPALIFAAVVLTLLVLLRWSTKSDGKLDRIFNLAGGATVPNVFDPNWKPHPIDDLIAQADQEFKETYLLKQTEDLESAAVAYRARRGRHPPPDFDKWFRFAVEKNAVVIEDYFDRIYHDLNPFWGVPAVSLRGFPPGVRFSISIRNGNVTFKQPKDKDHAWMPLWVDMISAIPNIPDLDMIINALDEPRVLVPWEEMSALVTQSEATKHTHLPNPARSLILEYSRLNESIVRTDQAKFMGGRFWNFYRTTCPPDSPGALAGPESDFSLPANFSLDFPYGSYQGYVVNSTIAKDPCLHPNLRDLLGPFIQPFSMSITKTLYPIFGGSKLPGNNDILLPPPIYYSDLETFSFKQNHDTHWDAKHSKIMWRGTASGGSHNSRNWLHFHRQRFVSLTNATQVSSAEEQSSPSLANWQIPHTNPDAAHPANFVLPRTDLYHIPALESGQLGRWFDSFTDTGFIDLGCGEKCEYMNRYFSIAPFLSLTDQFAQKYLPDIDGNSFSGRFRAFLLSSSLPIKATVFSEWHDSRLVPWRHYVPMDNTFIDFWGIMSYFKGWEDEKNKEADRDKIAMKIAMQGKEWAERVLRREDMQVYVYRLLLEWARICDDNRVEMSWVDDLISPSR